VKAGLDRNVWRQVPVAFPREHGSEISESKKGQEIVFYLGDCKLVNKELYSLTLIFAQTKNCGARETGVGNQRL
jgi:hypothetical protein